MSLYVFHHLNWLAIYIGVVLYCRAYPVNDLHWPIYVSDNSLHLSWIDSLYLISSIATYCLYFDKDLIGAEVLYRAINTGGYWPWYRYHCLSSFCFCCFTCFPIPSSWYCGCRNDSFIVEMFMLSICQNAHSCDHQILLGRLIISISFFNHHSFPYHGLTTRHFQHLSLGINGLKWISARTGQLSSCMFGELRSHKSGW